MAGPLGFAGLAVLAGLGALFLALVLVLGAARVSRADAPAEAGSAPEAVEAARQGRMPDAAFLPGLTMDERRVLYYVLHAYLNDKKHTFGTREIRKATHVELTPEMRGRVLTAVYSEVLRDLFPTGYPFSALEGCGACPSEGDIVLPSADDVARMAKDISQDGVPLVDFTAPHFELKDLRGKKVRLAAYAGRPVALAFWSPTCEHSLRAMAELEQVDRRFAATDLAVLAVIFSDEDRKAVERLSREEGLDIPVVISRDGKVRQAYQAHLVPTVVLINREGQMVKRLVGYKDYTVLEAEIAALF